MPILVYDEADNIVGGDWTDEAEKRFVLKPGWRIEKLSDADFGKKIPKPPKETECRLPEHPGKILKALIDVLDEEDVLKKGKATLKTKIKEKLVGK